MCDFEDDGLEEIHCGYCDTKFKEESEMITHVQDSHQDHDQDESKMNDGCTNENEVHELFQETFDIVCDKNRNTNDSESTVGIIDHFECHPCGVQFEKEHNLAEHINDLHYNEAEETIIQVPLSCHLCHKNFKSIEHLKEHEANSHITNSSTCVNLTEKNAVSDSAIGPRPRPHVCSNCDKSFYTSSDLWSHQRIHSGSKYTCNLCGKKLASSGSLHNHTKSVHELEKHFECHICYKKFALKQKLVNHVMTEHEGQKPFRCKNCNQGFVHKQSFEAHQRKHDGVVLKCKLCSKPFHDAGYLKKHLRWHERIQKIRNDV